MGDLRLYIPIVKVDKQARTVAGYATTETIDKQNEVVDYEGSKEAFSGWTKNVREMHEPKAVGKAIEIISDDDKKAIWVKAYISKGAEDTWQKIKEGILTGFSIGGQTVNKVVQIVKDAENGAQKQITRILKYKLNELSLVDNPANPEATLALVKMADGVLTQTDLVEDPQPMIVELTSTGGSATGTTAIATTTLTATVDMTKNEGGEEDEMTAELAKQLVEKVDAALARLDEFIKTYQAKTREIPVTKETTAKAADLATSSLETQPAAGAYPAKGEITGGTDTASAGAHAPVAGAKATPKGSTDSSAADPHPAGEGSAQTQDPAGSYPAKGPVKAMPAAVIAAIEAKEGKEDEEDAEAEPKKSKKVAKEHAEVEEDEEDVEDEEAMAAAKAKKVADATDLKKLQTTVDSLQKRINELETTPLPRKYKVEKTFGPAGEGEEPSEEGQLKKDYDEVLGWVKSGKELTREQNAKREAVLAKMIHNKFGNDARKLM